MYSISILPRHLRLLFAAQSLVKRAAAVITAVPARAAAAEHEKMSRLFEQYGTAVFRAAYTYLHNKSDAEDILQDTFLRYMDAAPAFENPQHEKAWLLRVAINLSKNRLNSGWFKNTAELEESYPCDGLGNELSFVWDAVRTLPPKYREPIHLFYHEGYSTSEIAEILGIKETNARTLLHRGRALLKTTLQEEYDFDDQV